MAQTIPLPRYEPESWNIIRVHELIQRTNNCYNYANNMMQNDFAQPGDRYLRIYLPDELITDEVIVRLAQWDGLRPINVDANENVPLNVRNLVALVIWPYNDFHWYRLDAGGNFSHKRGRTPATDLDESDNRITDPRQSDITPYTFVSFFQTDPRNVKIAGKYEWGQ